MDTIMTSKRITWVVSSPFPSGYTDPTAMDNSFDYPQIYKTLDNSVKKGHLKKHALSSSASDFGGIAQSLVKQECYELAATFLLGKAKCECTMNNFLAEAATLFTAARYFLQAEDKLDCLNSVSYGENMDNATTCLLRAAKLYEEGDLFTMAANTYVYLVDALMRHSRWGESIVYLKRPLEILSRDQMTTLQLLRRLADCQLGLCDWPGALNTCLRLQTLLLDPNFSTDVNVSWKLYAGYWKNAEVFRVLLVLLTGPPQKLIQNKGEGYCLAAYLLEDDESMVEVDTAVPDKRGIFMPRLSCIDEELFLRLQSFVVAYQSKDVVDVEAASASLQSCLDVRQWSLLLTLGNQLTQMTQSID